MNANLFKKGARAVCSRDRRSVTFNRHLQASVFTVLLMATASPVSGQYTLGVTSVTVAVENASRHTGVWNPANTGGGFGDWTFSTIEPTGGTATHALASFSPEIDTEGRSLALIAHSAINAAASAELEVPEPLRTGDTMRFTIAMTTSIGIHRFTLEDADGMSLLIFTATPTALLLSHGGTTQDLFSGVTDPETVIQFAFTQNAANLDWTASRSGGRAETQSGTVSGIASGAVKRLTVSNRSTSAAADVAGERHLYLNAISIESRYTIPTGASVALTEPAEVPYLDLRSGATLDLAGRDLTVQAGGFLALEGAFTASGAAVGFAGQGRLDVKRTPGPVLHDLLLSTGSVEITSTNGSRLFLDGQLHVPVGAALAGAEHVTLQSDAVLAGTSASRMNGDMRMQREIPSPAGWRMMASPVPTTYSELLSTLWTQGAAGSDHPPGQSTQYSYSGSDFSSISDLNDALEPGHGFIVYVFADTNRDRTPDPFPFTLTASGMESAVDLDLTDRLHPDPLGWTLLGNPFAAPVDFDDFTVGEGVDRSVYVWDNAQGAYVTYNGLSGSLTDGMIAPFQGFFVRNAASGARSLSLPVAAKRSQPAAAPFRKRHGTQPASAAAPDPVPRLVLRTSVPNPASPPERLPGHPDTLRDALHVTFTPDGRVGTDPRDAFKLFPLAADRPFLQLAARAGPSMDAPEPDAAPLLDIVHLPSEFGPSDPPLEIPLHLAAFIPGTAGWHTPTGASQVRLEQVHTLPEHWVVEWVDRATGERIDARRHPERVLPWNASAAKPRPAVPALAPVPASAASAEPGPLAGWALSIRAGASVSTGGGGSASGSGSDTGSGPGADAIPDRVVLLPNSPNPFNPATKIRFALPGSRHVRLDVHDSQGRRVAALVDRRMAAGIHEVVFDASTLASGSYLVRLHAGNQSRTRAILLVK